MMLKISRAALVAAMLSAPALPLAGVAPVWAEDTPGITTNLSIPTITAVDSSMDEAALRDALSGGFSKHVTELAALNATSITIPEVTFTMTVAPGDGMASATTTTTYKNIVLGHVVNGVAESASVESTSSTSAEGTIALGKLSAASFDIGGLLGLYSLVPSGGPEQPMKVLYKDFGFEGGTFTGPQASCELGRIASDEFSARPLKVSFAEMMAASQQLQAAKGSTPPAEALATVVGFLTDIFQAFSSAPITMDGLSCKGTGDTGEPFELAIGGLTMDGYAPGSYPAISVSGVKLGDGGKNSITLDAATLKTIDLSGPIAVLEAAKQSLTQDWFEANARALIPAFGGLSFSGLKADVDSPDEVGTRIKAGLGSFDLSLSNYVNGIPTTISTAATDVDVPLPADARDEGAAMLKSMGIDRVNLAYKIDAAWDRESKTINVGTVEVSGTDLGSLSLTGSIGNASDLLFDLNPQMMMMATGTLTVKALSLRIADAGVSDILMMQGAKQQNMDLAAYRMQMGAALEGLSIQLFGSTDSARALGAAVSDFVSGRKRTLNITVTPKSPNGVPLLQLMAQLEQVKDPLRLGAVLSGIVDVTGSAE